MAALNHPHIVTIFSVEEPAGIHFLTMELVEGQRSTPDLPRTVLLSRQIVEIARAWPMRWLPRTKRASCIAT